MITTRRKITNEQQRFGGYAAQPTEVTVRDRSAARRNVTIDSLSYDNAFVEPAVNNDYIAESFNMTDNRSYIHPSVDVHNQTDTYDYSYAQAQTVQEVPQVIRYTQLGEQATATETQKKRNQANTNIVHNLYEQQQAVEQPVKQERKQSKMSGKSKAALFAYIAVVLVLAVMVIATGLAVSNINARADELQNEIAVKTETVAAQKSQIAVLTDPEHIMGKALGSDMEVIDHDNENVIEILPETDPIVYQGRTNWFDKFCDFLSNVVGG